MEGEFLILIYIILYKNLKYVWVIFFNYGKKICVIIINNNFVIIL